MSCGPYASRGTGASRDWGASGPPRPGSKVFWSTWRYQQSQTGTYGSPSKATAEKGKLIFDETIAAYVSLLREVYAAA